MTHHAQTSTLLGITLLFGGLFAFFSLAHASTCHLITGSSQTPQGYASPVSFFGGSLLIKGDCNSNSVAVTVGNGEPTTYIYDKSYLWTGSQWQSKTLTGSNKQGAWIPEVATTNLTSSQSPTYYVAYTCEWVNQAWKCGCTTSSCTTNQWQLQIFNPSSSNQGGSAVSAEPRECTGSWEKVASDKYGWFDSGKWVNSTRDSNIMARQDHSKGTAPDGSAAVEHRITKGRAVNSPELDSPILVQGSDYCAVMLRYKMFNESGKWRTQGGKYMSIMGGRGQAGGFYLNRYNYPEGWSFYLLSPVVSGTRGSTNAKNGLIMGIGSANRSELGATCGGSSRDSEGGDPVGNAERCFEWYTGRYDAPVPTGEWMTIEQIVVMNDKNKRNGAASYTLNGREVVRRDNIMWAIDPSDAPGVFMEWRTMYGGTPEQELPAYDFKEWFKDFELWVIE